MDNPSLPVYVLDCFALLAYLEGEAGAERVRSLLTAAQQGQNVVCMSHINLGEVAYIVERERGLARAQEALAAVQQLPIQIAPADQDAVFAPAHIKAHHRLSFADAFAAAEAQQTGGTSMDDCVSKRMWTKVYSPRLIGQKNQIRNS